jgi:hypothetical protein
MSPREGSINAGTTVEAVRRYQEKGQNGGARLFDGRGRTIPGREEVAVTQSGASTGYETWQRPQLAGDE